MTFTFSPAFMANGIVPLVLIGVSVIFALLIATNALATKRHVNNDSFSRWELAAIGAAIFTFMAGVVAVGVSSATRSDDLKRFTETFEATYGVTLQSNEGKFTTTPQNASAPPVDKPLVVVFEHEGVSYSTTLAFSRTEDQWTALVAAGDSLTLDQALATGALTPATTASPTPAG